MGNVTRKTETVKVKLTNGEEREVQIYAYVTFREQQKIYSELMEGMNLSKNTKADDIEIPAHQMFKVISSMAEIIWADSNYSLDDVEGDTLSGVIIDRFAGFLGTIGFETEAGNNESSQHQEDK